MPVNIDQWFAGIGRFHSSKVIPKTKKNSLIQLKFSSACLHFSIMHFFLLGLQKLGAHLQACAYCAPKTSKVHKKQASKINT